MKLLSAYDPKTTEELVYKLWEESGAFTAKSKWKRANGNKPPEINYKQKSFIILLPPPNITGSLHMGHALNAVMSDILIRYHRMRGEEAVWLPGTDHAGIATQNVVEKQLRKEGTTRFELGREKFIERVWAWKRESGDMILTQLKKLGASCDWNRTRFTMDPAYARAVADAFIHYYKKGLLYRAERTINWCVRCGTSISDLEVEYKEEDATLYYIQYGPFTLATVRPETKFGDTALAVHPHDERYKKYIGKEIEIKTIDTDSVLDKPQKKVITLKVVGDEAVDPAFGTGVIKVTPAHDLTDYEISVRHNLPLVQVIDERGRMDEKILRYAGLKVAEAREKVAEDLEKLGLLIKKEPYHHNLAVCSRCASAIEPLPSWQWFLKMKELAGKSAGVVKSGKTKILPQNFEKIYFSWIKNIHDWCVSRQLWWGHQLPVYFCAKNKEEVGKFEIQEEYIVTPEKPKECPFCKECDMRQSEDVVDTWFSSALWPFAGLSEEDQKRLYPSSILITARDIINLWVGRMIFSGLEFKEGQVPFSEVLIHATVLTKDGKRMSKSLGTGIDPLALIEKYGADATRFGIIWQAMGGQDMHWDESAVMAGKKFANKVWNAARFVLRHSAVSNDQCLMTNKNKKILAQLEKIKKEVTDNFESYQFGQALHTLYDFFWHDFCDVYLEATKKDDSEETRAVLHTVLIDSLKLLHPFMPFITEELYGAAQGENQKKELLLVAEW